ncbi:hypothetical protein SAMN06264855_1177 [Halorubrum vacuolatum]|uniref:Uncharacterized protein n=1 Tax=Halorubrum vacuolatum TaxID=63740 RepID=A0A238XED2_HALVU|nr:hypothetical protein SAMN06264855_1177 [Halorubrum vacuolatum]
MKTQRWETTPCDWCAGDTMNLADQYAGKQMFVC